MATPNLVTFSDWQQKTNASLMSCAEELLEKLEDTSDLLAEIDEKYIRTDPDKDGADDRKSSMIQRFHAGLDSARNLVNVLKREKWRLNKREMSVELRMGELEDYKSHLKNDMSCLNQTVEALSLRVVQLENQLVEAQEVQEGLEADLQEHKTSLQDANDRNVQLYTENQDLKKALLDGKKAGNMQKENQMLKDEVSVLTQENHKLKDMVRDAEAMASPELLRKVACENALQKSQFPPSSSETHKEHAKEATSTSSGERQRKISEEDKKRNDNLSKLTKEFLDELTSLELREKANAMGETAAGGVTGDSVASGGSVRTSSSSSGTVITKKVSTADV